MKVAVPLATLMSALLVCSSAQAQNVDIDMIAHCAGRNTQELRYYPRRALDIGQEGRVVLDCVVPNDGGRPSPCRIAAETPEDFGFGEAALGIACALSMERLVANPETTRVDDQGRRIVRVIIPFTLR